MEVKGSPGDDWVVVTGQGRNDGHELGERGDQLRRRVGRAERQVDFPDEHRVVERGPGGGEVQVGHRHRAQRRLRGAVGGPGGAQEFGQVRAPLHGHGAHDRVLALEVAVEHRLAVLDPFGQAAGGDRVPPLRLGQFPGRGDDQSVTCGAIARSP